MSRRTRSTFSLLVAATLAAAALTLTTRSARAADWNDDAPPRDDADSSARVHVRIPSEVDFDHRGYNVALRPLLVYIPTGDAGPGMTFSGAGNGGGVGIGAYPWRHVGFYANIDGGTLNAIDIAAPHTGYSMRMGRLTGSLELALDSRRTGFYLAPGVAFVAVSGDRPEGQVAYSGADLELRGGWRFAPNRDTHPTLASVNVFAGVDYGRFTSVRSAGPSPAMMPADNHGDHAFFFIGVGIDLTR